MINSGLFSGADLFFWIACVGIGAITALAGVDDMFGKKKKEDSSH